MSQPPDAPQPSPSSRDQPGGSQEPARGRKRRAPAWSSAEIVDLIQVWGEASNVHNLLTSHRNAAAYGRMAASLAARGHHRSREHVRCKIKDLRQSYSWACLSGADPEACPHFLALDRILGVHAVPAPQMVIDPGAEGPLPDTEEEDAESQEPAGSLPETQDPRGTPLSRSPVSSEAGEASTSTASGPAGRTTLPAAATRAQASRRARNQEEYQWRNLRFLDHQLCTQDHWVQEYLRLRQRSLEALEEQGRALRGHLQSLLDRFPLPPAPASSAAPVPPAPTSTARRRGRGLTCTRWCQAASSHCWQACSSKSRKCTRRCRASSGSMLPPVAASPKGRTDTDGHRDQCFAVPRRGWQASGKAENRLSRGGPFKHEPQIASDSSHTTQLLT
ncbi:uncharacterized protein LOC142820891 [Pelodiscus sinensis]|uniref:uncharacterized protein LOC142820891 n=1 Tax=Pelodiscus sinensis TaxID=13735 RepID=UPI003F6B4B13